MFGSAPCVLRFCPAASEGGLDLPHCRGLCGRVLCASERLMGPAGGRWMLTEHVSRLLGMPAASSGSLEILAALAKSSLVCVSFVNPSNKQKLLYCKVNVKGTGTRRTEQETGFLVPTRGKRVSLTGLIQSRCLSVTPVPDTVLPVGYS